MLDIIFNVIGALILLGYGYSRHLIEPKKTTYDWIIGILIITTGLALIDANF